ncbi:hypothetical protein CPB85DRAFT_1351768 [Mucidula mucida]|nr:hypothetical protein CPB85DRAFT_1351768 [Mucidula mucida]
MSSKVPFVALATAIATIACCSLTRYQWLKPHCKHVSRLLLPHNLFSWHYAEVDQRLLPYPVGNHARCWLLGRIWLVASSLRKQCRSMCVQSVGTP